MPLKKSNEEDETAALLCGLARWRIAIHGGEDSSLKGSALDADTIENFYVCVDADILSMYANPSSAAGYLGLRYYGRAGKVHPEDFASAAFLSGALGRFILFSLECKQKSTEPRLLLPGHAEEIQRLYDNARRRANAEIEKATQEWRKLKDSAIALAKATQSGNTNSTDELVDRLKEFIASWFGENDQNQLVLGNDKLATGAYGLQAVEEAERYAELFATSKIDNEPCTERVLHITRYSFGQPINNFPPEASTEKSFQKHLISWKKNLSAKSEAVERIRQQVEQGLDDVTMGYESRELKKATDVYAMAWADTLDDAVENTSTNGYEFNLKLISGAEALITRATERVVTPMQLLKLFIQSRLRREGTDRVLNTLKVALDNLLESVHILIDQEDAQKNYLNWCQSLCELDVARKLTYTLNTEIYQTEQLQGVLSAWREMTNLLAAQEHAGKVTGRQSLFARIQALLRDSGTTNQIDLEQWIKAIEKGLHDAKEKLGFRSNEISLHALYKIPPKTPRNPPPLRLNRLVQDPKTVGDKMLWCYAKERDWKNLTAILSSIKEYDRDPVISIISGLAWCIFGRWYTARRSFYLATSSVSNVFKSFKEKNIAIEAAYACAVARRITASKPEDLDNAENHLEAAKKLTKLNNQSSVDIRFITEGFSLKTICLWAQARTTIDYPIQKNATEQLLLALDIYEAWRDFTRSETEQDQYIVQYTRQELLCDILQLYWLGKYGIYGGHLLPLPRINACDSLLERVKDAAKSLIQQCEFLDDNKNDDNLPSVTSLVQVNVVLARLTILEENTINTEEAKDICDDERYRIIPVADKTRYHFFKLLLNFEETRRINHSLTKQSNM